MVFFANEAYKIEEFISMDHSPFKDFDEFWQHLQTEDEVAWDIFQNNYGRLLFYFFLKRNISEFDSKDLVQEVYLNFWQKISKKNVLSFENEYSLTSYLFKIAARAIIDNYRKKLKVLTNFEFNDREDLLSIVSNDFFFEENKMQAIALLRRVEKLLLNYEKNIKHSNIFKDYYFEGSSIETIAKKYESSPVNIRVILHRIKMYLLEKL